MMAFTSMARILAAILLLGLITIVTRVDALTEDGDVLSGPNVCTYSRWETVYFTQNVTFSCWETSVVTCEESSEESVWYSLSWCRGGGHRCKRWPNGDGTCYHASLTTCWRLEERCDRQRVTYEYCCEGYEEDGQGGCQDSIVCGSNNGGCDHLCRSDGSNGHRCECFNGYMLEGRTQCTDIDECAQGTDECDHTCENSDGTYYCTCPIGYRLASPTECEEIDECDYGNGGCEHQCHNTDGAFYCECEEGFERIDGYFCNDVDECAHLNGGCSHECYNTHGSFVCICPHEGYELEDGRTCVLGAPGGNGTGPGDSERVSAGDLGDEGQGAPVGVIVGALIGVALLLGLVAATLLLLRRFGLLGCCVPVVAAPVIVAGKKKGSTASNRPLSEPNVYQTPEYEEHPPNYDDIVAFDNKAYGTGAITGSKPSAPEGMAYENVVYDNKGFASVPGNQEPQPYSTIADGDAEYDNEAAIYDDCEYVTPTPPGSTKSSDSPALNEILNAKNMLRSVPRK